MLREKLQGPGPGGISGLLVVPLRGEIHEGMVRPRVGVELMRYPQPGQFSVVFPQVVLRRIYVDFPEMEQYRALDAAGQIVGGLGCIAPGGLDVPTVVGNRGLDVGVGRGPQPGLAAAHAEAGDSDTLAVDGRVVLQPIHGGIDVGDGLRVAQKLAPGQAATSYLFFGNSVK